MIEIIGVLTMVIISGYLIAGGALMLRLVVLLGSVHRIDYIIPPIMLLFGIYIAYEIFFNVLNISIIVT